MSTRFFIQGHYFGNLFSCPSGVELGKGLAAALQHNREVAIYAAGGSTAQLIEHYRRAKADVAALGFAV